MERGTVFMLSSFPVSLLAGAVLGFLSGLGTGGGSLLLLWLTMVVGMPQQDARMVNLLFYLLGPIPDPTGLGSIVVATGGTSDIPVAEEAALTAEVHGNRVVRLYDVGVAGIHRLLSHTDEIMNASVIVAVAGMEGALASVIGGLADCPVIAVPTSVGYGAAFGGVAALLSMLNSCASGVSVVNIDNGFGAGYLAGMMNHMGGKQ